MQTQLAPTQFASQPTVVLAAPLVVEGFRSIGCDVMAATGFPAQLLTIAMTVRPTVVLIHSDGRNLEALQGCIQPVRSLLRSARIIVLLPQASHAQAQREFADLDVEVTSDASDATTLRLLLGVGFAAPCLLTRREVEVLELAARGLTNQAIARRLGLQTNTVKNYLRAVHRKFGAKSRTEAVMIAARAGYPVLPLR